MRRPAGPPEAGTARRRRVRLGTLLLDTVRRKQRELKELQGLGEQCPQWQLLKDRLLLTDGWAEPTTTEQQFAADGEALVGERIYVMGYGAGVVELFCSAMFGQGQHSIRLDDGPRTEKITLQRPGRNKDAKVPWLIKSVMSTSYRRVRIDLDHRQTWCRNPRTLSRALTADEANELWSSFGTQQSPQMDSTTGEAMPRSNLLDDSNPDQPFGLQLESSGTRLRQPAFVMRQDTSSGVSAMGTISPPQIKLK
eukprot:COSAG01_NODE_16604_length_1222_cov_0.800534_1_plen_251_part_10